MLPYWITSTLAATPAVLWAFFGLGIPWALVVLPRKDWRDRILMIALAFAFGPALLTAWMFILGSIGEKSLRLETTLAGTAVIALVGLGLAWRKRRFSVNPKVEVSQPLAIDEKLLIILIVIAAIVQWFSTAYWPFTVYDALWVYGYEGRLYTLLGHIPNMIGYYPQFLPLQYTYAQLAVGGINDHAARAVLPFLNLGSVLAVYVLGSRLFTRRAGIFAAAMWALYPHMGEWSRFGDLEIALTFLLTLSAAFFLMAWNGDGNHRRYALIAGLVFGVAMWTKPTAAAFVWGVILLVAIELARVRFDWRAWHPRFETALITGLACLPLGTVWYMRNILLGHPPIEFPTAFWLTQAARSGAEFGWPLLALLALLGYLIFNHRQKLSESGVVQPAMPRDTIRARSRAPLQITSFLIILIGLILVLVGLLPSIFNPHRMGLVEWLLLAAGCGLLFVILFPLLRQNVAAQPIASKIGWALALAFPYFVTWFYSYSYHYRLSFAIVPLMILPTAVILSYWIPSTPKWSKALQLIYLAGIVVICFPGVISALYDPNAGWDWLWTDKLPDDMARYQSGNPALMSVVEGLQIYLDEHDTPLVVVAPGVRRLPFFFPAEDIRINDAPTRLSQLNGVTYFIDSSPEGSGAYDGIPLQQNQVISALALAGSSEDDLIHHAWWKDDGIFRYDVYALNLGKRFINPHMIHDPEEPVEFGGFARFRGHGIGADTFWPGRPVYMQLYFEVLTPPPEDYMLYVHLRDRDGKVWATWDGPVTNSQDGRYYSTLVWEPGEYIRDNRLLKITDQNPPEGDDYSIWFGFYNLPANERVPVTINGAPAGDGFRIDETIKVRSKPPE
jgi:4-amino-4-deoxy-L-arabinose transferase-like glycosyltransferase